MPRAKFLASRMRTRAQASFATNVRIKRVALTHPRNGAVVAQLVERVLGKDEVTSSILVNGSTTSSLFVHC
jgi:hypothetical protein